MKLAFIGLGAIGKPMSQRLIDNGYVGKGVGTIALYRNRDEIKRVPEEEGVQALIDLIKEDGKWVDP